MAKKKYFHPSLALRTVWPNMPKTTLQMEELVSIYKALKPSEVVLDCRTPEEFAEGHVPGAINMDHETMVDSASALKKFSKVFVYCRSGGRAAWAVDELERQGLTHLVCVTHSGMPDWIEAAHPVE